MLRDAGFTDVQVTSEQRFTLDDVVSADLVEEYARFVDGDREALADAASKFASVRVRAVRPA
jgi:hypothetical protein